MMFVTVIDLIFGLMLKPCLKGSICECELEE